MSIRSGSGRSPEQSVRVLVVEDSVGIRETTASILREEGYVVAQASDGARAVELLAGHDIDVLLLDLRLPRMDGPAVLEAVDILPTVVVLSAFEYFDQVEVEQRFASVVFEFLRKPVSPVRLIAATAAAAEHALSRSN